MNEDDSPKNPDAFFGDFDPITLELPVGTDKGMLLLAIVKENNALYLVIRKRFPKWGIDITLDAVRLSTAVNRIRKSVMPSPRSYRDEILRVAFEHFILKSPFTSYVRKSLNQWDAAQFFNKLRALAPAINIKQPRQSNDEQGSVGTRVPEVS